MLLLCEVPGSKFGPMRKKLSDKDLKTWPMHIVSQTATIALNRGISIIVLMVVVNGLCNTKDI